MGRSSRRSRAWSPWGRDRREQGAARSGEGLDAPVALVREVGHVSASPHDRLGDPDQDLRPPIAVAIVDARQRVAESEARGLDLPDQLPRRTRVRARSAPSDGEVGDAVAVEVSPIGKRDGVSVERADRDAAHDRAARARDPAHDDAVRFREIGPPVRIDVADADQGGSAARALRRGRVERVVGRGDSAEHDDE